MRLLLDTHVLLWWLRDDPRLEAAIAQSISDAETIFVSVVSLWEIVIKTRIGKFDGDISKIERALAANDFHRLAIEPHHLETLATLQARHKDPFDHLIIAQAISEDAVLISQDRAMRQYPVRLL